MYFLEFSLKASPLKNKEKIIQGPLKQREIFF